MSYNPYAPTYQNVPATLSNTIRTADCLPTGTFCSNFEVCCSKSCKIAKGKQARVCCLPEGALCDEQNPGLALCCAGTMCMPIKKADGSDDPQISACQVMAGGMTMG